MANRTATKNMLAAKSFEPIHSRQKVDGWLQVLVIFSAFP